MAGMFISDFLKSLKRHVVEHYLFYILAYVLVSPMWLKLIVVFLYKNMNVVPLLFLFNAGALLIFIAAGFKHYRSKLKVFAGILFVAGLLIECIVMAQLFVPAFSQAAIALPLLISSAMSGWWVIIYFLDLSGMDREKSKLLGKQVLKYFILCAVLLYGSSALLSGYYRRQIEAILAADSVNVAGGLDSTQIEIMMDEKMWQVVLLGFLQFIVIIILFFYFYNRVKTIVENR